MRDGTIPVYNQPHTFIYIYICLANSGKPACRRSRGGADLLHFPPWLLQDPSCREQLLDSKIFIPILRRTVYTSLKWNSSWRKKHVPINHPAQDPLHSQDDLQSDSVVPKEADDHPFRVWCHLTFLACGRDNLLRLLGGTCQRRPSLGAVLVVCKVMRKLQLGLLSRGPC
jgi:hypothetical protein